MPPSPALARLIRVTAILVHNRGSRFEEALLARLSSDPDANRFGFLVSKTSHPGLYYRWCLLVLGNNETFTSHSLMPFQFVQNGPYFIPPPIYQQAKPLKQEKPVVVEKRELVEKEDSDSKRRKELGYRFSYRLIRRSNLLLDSVRVGVFV